MNPMRAFGRNYLPYAGAYAGKTMVGKRRGFSWSQHQYGDIPNRFGVVHLPDGVGHCLDVAAHPGEVAGPRPMSGDHGPDLPRHLAHLVFDAVEHMLATIAGGAGQPLRSAA